MCLCQACNAHNNNKSFSRKKTGLERRCSAEKQDDCTAKKGRRKHIMSKAGMGEKGFFLRPFGPWWFLTLFGSGGSNPSLIRLFPPEFQNSWCNPPWSFYPVTLLRTQIYYKESSHFSLPCLFFSSSFPIFRWTKLKFEFSKSRIFQFFFMSETGASATDLFSP